MNPVPSCLSCPKILFLRARRIGEETPRLRYRSARGNTAARCHSDWSDERSEERSGGISLTVVHPVNINIVDLLMKGIPD